MTFWYVLRVKRSGYQSVETKDYKSLSLQKSEKLYIIMQGGLYLALSGLTKKRNRKIILAVRFVEWKGFSGSWLSENIGYRTICWMKRVFWKMTFVRNVGHKQQLFSELHSTGRSHYIREFYYKLSWLKGWFYSVNLCEEKWA